MKNSTGNIICTVIGAIWFGLPLASAFIYGAFNFAWWEPLNGDMARLLFLVMAHFLLLILGALMIATSSSCEAGGFVKHNLQNMHQPAPPLKHASTSTTIKTCKGTRQ